MPSHRDNARPNARRGAAARSFAPAPLPISAPRGLRIPLLAVVLAWGIVFFPQLLLGQRFVLGDASAFLPFADYSRARWAETHERTYWNPYVLMGVESVASLADSRPQYLPDLLLDVADRAARPAFSPQLWLLLAHLGGALSLLLLATRMMGASAWSAAAVAIGWLLAVPSLLPFVYGHDAQFVSDALLPITILGTHVVMTSASRGGLLAGVVALALPLGVQAIHGHPQIVVYSGVLALTFAVYLAWRRSAWSRLGVWVAAAGLGAAIGAAGWWPALLYSSDSFRGMGERGLSLAEVDKFSFAARDLVSLVWPRAVGYGGPTYWGGMDGTDYSPYLGVVLVAFALRGAMTRVPGARMLAVVSVLAVLHALGSTLGPLYGAIHQIPLWNKFRVPFYTLIVASLALSLLAARGWDAFAAETPKPTARRAWIFVLAAIAVLGAALAWSPLREVYAGIARAARAGLDVPHAGEAAAAAGRDLILRAALLGAAFLVIRTPRFAAFRGPAFAVLLAIDLGTVTVPALVHSSGPVAEVAPPAPTALARTVREHPRFRAYVGNPAPIREPSLGIGQFLEAYSNFWITWRARCLTGNHGAAPGAWRPAVRYEMTRQASVLRAWGVGFFDLPRETPGGAALTPVAEDDHSRVYALAAAPGRAYTAAHVVRLDDLDQVGRAMMTDEFQPAVVAVTTEPGLEGDYPGSPGCTIEWKRDEPEHLVLETAGTERAFLVVADAHGAGWTATVDGTSAAIARVNLLARGVALPAGRHVVEMRYRTPGMGTGVTSTRIALAIAVLLAITSAIFAVRERSYQI